MGGGGGGCYSPSERSYSHNIFHIFYKLYSLPDSNLLWVYFVSIMVDTNFVLCKYWIKYMIPVSCEITEIEM